MRLPRPEAALKVPSTLGKEGAEADVETDTESKDEAKGVCDQKSAGRPSREALGRSRGGLTSKIHLAADTRCRPISRVNGRYARPEPALAVLVPGEPPFSVVVELSTNAEALRVAVLRTVISTSDAGSPRGPQCGGRARRG
jgi:hypothetical protein